MKHMTAAIPLAAALLALGACGLDPVDEPGTPDQAEAGPEEEQAAGPEPEAEPAEEPADEPTDEADTAPVEEDVEEPEVEPGGEPGSRDHPLALGESVEGADWVVTVNEVQFGADDQVAAANQFNDPAPEGHSFVLINVTVTYTGEDSETPMFGTSFAWVTSSGETLDSSDVFVVAPDGFDSSRELYDGGSETGNLVIAVPEGDDGLIRVRLGMFDREEAFVAPQ